MLIKPIYYYLSVRAGTAKRVSIVMTPYCTSLSDVKAIFSYLYLSLVPEAKKTLNEHKIVFRKQLGDESNDHVKMDLVQRVGDFGNFLFCK